MFSDINWNELTDPNIILSEKSKREPFTIFHDSSDPAFIQTNIGTINSLEQSTNENELKVLKNYVDISNNIQTYLTTQQQLHNNNSKYHYDDILAPNTIINGKDTTDIRTVLQDDINTLTLYQNAIYISSSIACATLLIAAIIIIPLQKK